jgi:hypothetical protein
MLDRLATSLGKGDGRIDVDTSVRVTHDRVADFLGIGDLIAAIPRVSS